MGFDASEWEPEHAPWLKEDIQASDVLAGALEFWGKGGERWIQRQLGYTRSAGCMYGGGLYAAGIGNAKGGGTVKKNTAAIKKAEAFILDELEALGFFDRKINYGFDKSTHIVRFNDNQWRQFSEVRAVTCGALKRAVAAEQKERDAQGQGAAGTSGDSGGAEQVSCEGGGGAS